MIIPNMDKKDVYHCTVRLISIIDRLGAVPLMDLAFQEIFPLSPIQFDSLEHHQKKCDAIIAVGGDGTIIHCARYALAANKPLLGINAGRLGFLAQLEASEMEEFLPCLLQKQFSIDRRMLLETVYHAQNESKTFYALNDAVLSKGERAKIVDINVYCNEKFMDSYRADGIIFSTPTGSTAYSLSAGGPIIDPQVQSILMTLICPHTLFARPVLFHSDKVLRVEGKYINNSNLLYLTVDGQDPIKISDGESVEIKISQKQIQLVSFDNRDFYEILSKKIITRR